MSSRAICFVLFALVGCSEETETARTTDSGVADTAIEDTGSGETSSDAGTEKDCLEVPGNDAFFTLNDATKCVVARYDVPVGRLGALTWGRHNGPLGFSGSGTIVRYEVPASATGSLTVKKTEVMVSGVPSDAFFGGFALDIPLNNFTAFSYTGMGAGYPGELLLTTGTDLVRYRVNGFYAATFVASGRLLYTGLGPLSKTATTDNAGGLYAADACGSNKLIPDGDASCTAPQKIATWEAGSSGPIASDPNDNVFAILSKFGGNQELRGFEKSTIARGAPPAAGDKIFSDGQYTSDLVADGSAVYWQPNDPMAFAPLDPMMMPYTVAGKKIAPAAAASPFIKLKTAGTAVTLLRDSSRRIWVGVPGAPMGDAGPTSSTLFVIRARKP